MPIWHIKVRPALPAASRDKVERVRFGKRILFIDRTDLVDVQIVAAYRSQSVVENAFIQMKDPFN